MAGSPYRPGEEDASLVDFIKISSKEEPRHYSAKIAWNARNNSHMPLLATGAPAINCAVKAVAIARRLLEEDSLELFVQPAFRDRSMANSLALYISSKSKRATEGLIQNPSELTAGKGSKPTVIAGAISNRAREGGCPNITGQSPGICSQAAAAALARRCVTSPGTLLPLPSKQAASGVSGLPCVARSQRVPPALPPGIGPEAVCNAIMAVCHARLYLEQDHLDVRVVPSFQVRGRVLSVGAGAVAVVCGGEGG
jgi:stage V sporulation protein SpoVS